jgi:hypothetical protein
VVRKYIQSRGLKVSPQQLEVLVPAYDAAYDLIRKSGRFSEDDEVLKTRLAQLLVDLVITEGQTDVRLVAQTAVRLILVE